MSTPLRPAFFLVEELTSAGQIFAVGRECQGGNGRLYRKGINGTTFTDSISRKKKTAITLKLAYLRAGKETGAGALVDVPQATGLVGRARGNVVSIGMELSHLHIRQGE